MAWASQQGSVIPTRLDTGKWYVDSAGSYSCLTDFKSHGHLNKVALFPLV